MNILISSVGKQVFLVNAFKDALNCRGKVFAIDFDKNAKALKTADECFIAPPFNNDEYIPWLVALCSRHEIKMLLTLNVDELIVLEPHRFSFFQINCRLIGGEINKIRMTNDKIALSRFCSNIGINTPITLLNDDLQNSSKIRFPVIAKHRFGKGSRGQAKLSNKEELQLFKNEKTINSYIFQYFIDGEEYGLDVVNDFNAQFAGLFVRKKYAMKNGETFEAITQSTDEWIDIGKKLSREINHQGTIDIDFMVDGKKKYLIDINHRFGGGYIFSHAAGANLPKTFINWLLEKKIKNDWFNPQIGVHGLRNKNGITVIK